MATHPGVPGEPTHTGTAFVETAASTIQSFAPINSIHQHQCAAHLYADDMTRQLVVHHFCAHQNDEMRQCLLYDSEEANARLIGVEYMISERLFLPLPDEEKRLWHSHEYEVKSGLLFMPGVPGPIERKDMEKVVKTYGKVFHFWQVDKGDALPVGPANLMMAFTRDGQLYDHLVQSVEKNYGVSFEKEREKRAYMEGLEHGVDPKANGGGTGLRLVLKEINLKPAVAAAT